MTDLGCVCVWRGEMHYKAFDLPLPRKVGWGTRRGGLGHGFTCHYHDRNSFEVLADLDCVCNTVERVCVVLCKAFFSSLRRREGGRH